MHNPPVPNWLPPNHARTHVPACSLPIHPLVSPFPRPCSCYESLPDSRTGADMLPWLLRGAVLAGGEADFSGVHTALLYAGQVVVGVGEFRCQCWAFGRCRCGTTCE